MSFCCAEVIRLGRALAVAVGIVASAASAWAQYPAPGATSQAPVAQPGTSAERPRFSVDAAVQPSERGEPEVRFDYRLKRTDLLFERGPNGYRAAYEVRVIVYTSRGKRQVTGDAWTRELRAATYAGTRISNADVVDFVVMSLAPGKYWVEVAITDLVAERLSGTGMEIRVPEEPEAGLWFTDLTLGTRSEDSSDPGRGGIVPLPSRRYGENLAQFACFFEIVDRGAAKGEGPYKVSFRIKSDLGQSVASGDTIVARAGVRTPVILLPGLPTLDPGSYRLIVELTNPGAESKGSARSDSNRREKPFTVEISGRSLALDPKTAIEVLGYIADDREQAEMNRLASQEERTAFWESFWRRRDPNPETPENEVRDEFYRRVEYANQHFGVGTAGWRTDMGREYIRHGRPDEIVRNPFNFDRPPEEIWYYYEKRLVLVFVDHDGFGRYELDRTRTP